MTTATLEAAKAIPEDVMQTATDIVDRISKVHTWKGDCVADVGSAILAERQRIVTALKEEADLTPCAEDAMVTRSNARLIEADFSYEEAERLAEKEEDEAHG